jgi:hypothetical protein
MHKPAAKARALVKKSLETTPPGMTAVRAAVEEALAASAQDVCRFQVAPSPHPHPWLRAPGEPPADKQAYAARALSSYVAGNYSAVAADARRALAVDQSDALAPLAAAYAAMGHPSLARAIIELGRARPTASLRVVEGYLELDSGHQEAGCAAFQSALTLAPNDEAARTAATVCVAPQSDEK